jgi:hypothetical protein
MGHSRCDGTAWGACIGNRIVAASLPGLGLGLGGLHPLSTGGACTDPCDPNTCTTVTGSTGDVNAPGVAVGDAGVSIAVTPPAGSTCQGLFCQVETCATAGVTTTISGTVYDPAQKNPLYNATVFIPLDATAPLATIATGASCDTCSGGSPAAVVAVAQTGPDGKFTLNNAPSGANIPLIVQMGQWRRKVTLPSVTGCTDNVVDKQYTHLPKNRFDGDGNAADIPRMAIATGSSDPFECMLVKAGIDPAEIDKPGTGARIEYYVMNGNDRSPGGAPAGTTLTGDLPTLLGYDVVILPCEGSEVDAHVADVPNLVSYANAGGRIFTTHFGYTWLATPNRGVAQNQSDFFGTADWSRLDQRDRGATTLATIDQSFPKGAAFAQWLQNIGATTTLGQQTINEPRHDARSAINPPSQRWMYGWGTATNPAGPSDMLLAMTFNTPVNVPEAQQCGRVVFSDFHVAADARVEGQCRTVADCGYGSSCSPAGVEGNCANQACAASSECPSGYTCAGSPVPGTCTPTTCNVPSDCGNNNCVGNSCRCVFDRHCGSNACIRTCAAKACTVAADCGGSETCTAGACAPKTCTRSSDCAGGLCSAGVCECIGTAQCGGRACSQNQCAPEACGSSAQCGSSETCTGAVAGSCQKLCDSDTDCAVDGQFPSHCVNGLCKGCYADSECPTQSGTPGSCTGGSLGDCTSSTTFPQECQQGNLSPQEAALEFMLFDLTSCVSPDGVPPPPPPITLNPVSFPLDFTATCPDNQAVTWREVDWEATVPDTASIKFTAQSADDTTGLDTAPSTDVAVATTSTAPAGWDIGVIPFTTVSPEIPSKNVLRITVTLTPTTDKRSSPMLQKWRVLYDCADAK